MRGWTLIRLLVAATVAVTAGDAQALTRFGDPVNVAPVAAQPLPQYGSDVGIAANGGSAVVYTEYASDVDHTWIQRFDATVTAVGDRFRLGPADQPSRFGAIAMAPDGRFVAASQVTPTANNPRIEVRRFTADGTGVGGAIVVDGANTESGSTPPGLAIADDGRFAVAWVRSGAPRTLQLQRYEADGSPAGSPQQIDSGVTATAQPSIAMAPDGRLIVTWHRSTAFGTTGVVPGRRFLADGAPDGGELTLHSGAMNVNYTAPAAGMADDGAFAIAFQGLPDAQGAYEDDVFGRRFNATGAATGPAFGVSDYTPYIQRSPDVAVDTDGDLLVAFEGQVGTEQWSYLRHFGPDGTPQGPNEHVGTAPSGYTHDPGVAVDGARSVFSWTLAAAGASEVLLQRWDYATVPGPPPPPPPPPPPSDGAPPPVGAAGAPTASPPPAPPATLKAPILSQVVAFPSTKRCASRRRFAIRLRVPRNAAVVRAVVKVNGRQVAVRRGSRLRSTVDLRALPKGRFTVGIELRLTDGRTVKGSRRYRTCAKKQGGGKPRV